MTEPASEPGGALSLPVVRSALFARFPRLIFGISTRAGGKSREPFGLNLSFRVGDDRAAVQANRELFFGSLGVPLARLASPTQVHGAQVRVVEQAGSYDECDGVVSGTPGLFLAITVADCVPLFLYDPVREAVAALHAGWRGSRLGIVQEGLQEMRTRFGTLPGDLYAVIGQSAGVCCYEVGEEVACQFEERFVVRTPGSKPHLDLHAFHLDLLLGSGVARDRIELLTSCTICHPARFHSYRRERDLSGRMMGVIGLAGGVLGAGK